MLIKHYLIEGLSRLKERLINIVTNLRLRLECFVSGLNILPVVATSSKIVHEIIDLVVRLVVLWTSQVIIFRANT